jgi:hypothetical protein
MRDQSLHRLRRPCITSERDDKRFRELSRADRRSATVPWVEACASARWREENAFGGFPVTRNSILASLASRRSSVSSPVWSLDAELAMAVASSLRKVQDAWFKIWAGWIWLAERASSTSMAALMVSSRSRIISFKFPER